MQISHLTRPVERVRSRYCKLCSSHCDDNMMMPRPGHCSPASGDVIMRPRDSRCYTTEMRAGHLTWMARWRPRIASQERQKSHISQWHYNWTFPFVGLDIPGRIAECAEDTDFSRECLARLMTCLLSGLAIVNPCIVKGRLFLIVLYFFP